MGFSSAFKGLMYVSALFLICYTFHLTEINQFFLYLFDRGSYSKRTHRNKEQ